MYYLASTVRRHGNAAAIETVCNTFNEAVPPTKIRIIVMTPCVMPQKLRKFLLGSMFPFEVNMANTKVVESASATKQVAVRSIHSVFPQGKIPFFPLNFASVGQYIKWPRVDTSKFCN